MLGRTHKAFGVATMSGTGLMYQQITQQNLPQTFLDTAQTQPFSSMSGLFVTIV